MTNKTKPTPVEVADVISHSYLNEHVAFIVRAVNSHEELVHALKSANGYINDPKANEVFNRIIAKAEGK